MDGRSKAGSKETRETRLLECFQARDDGGLEITDLANKNTGGPVKFDFRIQSKYNFFFW